jgi:diguanylate cyclase (GGDEF)-like protein
MPDDDGEYLSAEDLDGIPPAIAKRLLRSLNQSPSSWIVLVDTDLTTRFVGRSSSWIQGYDTSQREGKQSLDRLHPDDVEPLMHAIDQLRAAKGQSTPNVPVLEPIRYRLRRLDGHGWVTVETRVINVADDPIANCYVLISQLAGGELDGVDHVLDLLVGDAPLPEVLAACARLVPHYIGSAAVVALVDDAAVVGAPAGSPAERLCRDERWWNKAISDGLDFAPLRFAGYPQDLATEARDEGFKSAWVMPVSEVSTGDILGAVVVWVRLDVEFNIGMTNGLRKTARLARLVIGEQRTHHALQREALTDPLTGVGNRSALRRRLDGARDEVSLAVIDLDDFKPVNDTHGHEIGDEVLQIVAQRIAGAVREDDLVVRLGGDEFAVVFADGTAPEGVALSTERITATIREPMQVSEQLRLVVTGSVGLATGHTSEVLPEADRELYKAKRTKM